MHRHICNSPLHSGPRVRTHYEDHCTQPYDTSCNWCHDEELAQGATFEYHDSISFSDADQGLYNEQPPNYMRQPGHH